MKNASITRDEISKINENNHTAFEIDVANKNSLDKVLSEVISKYNKPPSVMVNCAGITKDNFLLKMSEEDFDDVVKINLKVVMDRLLY